MSRYEENANQPSMSKCISSLPRTNTSVICELAYERKEIADNLAKLRAAIAADPQAVSNHHKQLWCKQAQAMQEYVDVLGERIKDLLDN